MQSGVGLSQTTASRSDLSIDEINLRRFKEYMLLSDRQKETTNKGESLYAAHIDNNGITIDDTMEYNKRGREGG